MEASPITEAGRVDYSMTVGEPLPVAVRAAGCRIETADGSSYLDACGGAMVMLLGHSHPRVVEAIQRQSQVLNYAYRFSFRNDPMLDLAERVARHAPGQLEWSFFNSSGSEANESAMHLAVLYWELQGKPAKIEFLSRVTSYHGSTLGALSLSGSRWRAPFESLLHKYAAVPNADTAEQGAAELEAAILSRGAEHVAAFIVEPVTGSSGAAVDLPAGYLQAVREVCDRHQVLLVADEIITGFGRTGRWFGVEHHDAVPDVITFGKGIGGGAVPLSGMVATRVIRDVVGNAPNGFSYGHTFSGYPLGCAVGCAVIDTIEEEGLVEAAAVKGDRVRGELEAIARRHPIIAGLRGRGLLQGIELRHPETGKRFTAADRVTGRVVAAARERGVMIYACPTPVLNEHMDAVMLAPPLIVSDDEVAEMLAAVEGAVAAVEATV
jgi:adenosylmethionine-8-amino-7-oxononanoate aminotransferase